RQVPPTLVHRHELIPISLSGSTLTLAMSDPSNLVALNELKFLTGYDCKVAVASISTIARAIEQHYDSNVNYDEVLNAIASEDLEVVQSDEEIDLKELERATEDAPVVRL